MASEDYISKSQIATLLQGIERYNPENLKTLLPYVYQQVKENSYDITANLAVLKLYQFNPHLMERTEEYLQVVSSILLKTLMTLPSGHFTLCKSLIDGRMQDEVEIGRVIYLHRLLVTCEFSLFWKEIEATPQLIEPITGFKEAIRNYICTVVQSTYQNINKDILASYMGSLDSGVLEDMIGQQGWKGNSLNEVVFVASQDDNCKTKNITEKVTFEKLKTMFDLVN